MRLLLLSLGVWVPFLVLACGTQADRPPVDEPRALVFDTSEHRLGKLRPGSTHRVEVAWRRTGRGPLRILRARTDCGCAVVDGIPPLLPEGARGTWVIELTARGEHGPLRHRLRVITDAEAGRDVVDVHLVGHVATDYRIRPARLDLPAGAGGTAVTRVVEVTWDPATLEMALPGARLVSLSGDVQVAPPARPGNHGVQLVVTFSRPSAPGPFRGWLEVDLGSRGPVLVPIRGRVEVPREAASIGDR